MVLAPLGHLCGTRGPGQDRPKAWATLDKCKALTFWEAGYQAPTWRLPSSGDFPGLG